MTTDPFSKTYRLRKYCATFFEQLLQGPTERRLQLPLPRPRSESEMPKNFEKFSSIPRIPNFVSVRF